MPKLVAICSGVFGLAVALGASGAHAQMSTTNCMAMGPDTIHCDTMPNDDGQAILGQALHNLIFGDQEKVSRMRVGKMIANGDCQGALKYALERGRFDLARSIKPFCQANDQPPQNVAMASPGSSEPEPASPANQMPASCTPDQINYAQSVGVDCHSLGARWPAN